MRKKESTEDLVLTEAIRVIDKMNKQSVVFCAFIYLIREVKLRFKSGESTLEKMEIVINDFCPNDVVAHVDGSYLKYVGVFASDLVYKKDLVSHLNISYGLNIQRKALDLPLNKGNEFFDRYPVLSKIIINFGFDNLKLLDSFLLNVVGDYIAIAYLKSKGFGVEYPSR